MLGIDESQAYRQMQLVAKKTIAYIKNCMKPGMKLLEIRKLCEEKLLESGADSLWYWDVGAFVFAGDETTVSVSGGQYVTADRVIGDNDIVTIDLSPQKGNIWGDYARTIVMENGFVNLDFMGNLGHFIAKAKEDRNLFHILHVVLHHNKTFLKGFSAPH